MLVYHGTDYEFDGFDPEMVGSASGQDKGGWGFYFSDSEDIAGQHISGKGSVREYDIPKGPYLDLDATVDLYDLQQILKELESAGVDDSELDEFRSDFMEDESYLADTTYNDIYVWVGYALGSKRNASKFFADMGYVGNKFADKTDSSSTNYVVYDERKIRKL